MGSILQPCVGLMAFCLAAWLISEDRRRLPLREIVAGIGLQLLLAGLLLHFAPARRLVESVNDLVSALQAATDAGTAFVFGYLGGAMLPFEVSEGSSAMVLAFRALPLILVISALSAVLTYWRVLPWIVSGFSRLLQKPFGIGGAVGLGTAANIFVGMVEAPLFIRHYLAQMSRSGLFVVMCSGMATIAGTVLFLYAAVIADAVPGAAGHLLVASVISAPAAVMIARIMIPGSGQDSGEGNRPGIDPDQTLIDECFLQVESCLDGAIRPSDTPGRWDLQTLALVMPQTTMSAAKAGCNDIKQAICEKLGKFEKGLDIRMRVITGPDVDQLVDEMPDSCQTGWK